MENDKLCPFRAFGPCPTAQCRFWIAGLEDCALVIAINRDEVLVEARLEADTWKVAYEEAQRELANAQVHSADCLEAMEGMVSRAEYDEELHKVGRLTAEIITLEKELADARAELEETREKDSEEAGGPEESAERESE